MNMQLNIVLIVTLLAYIRATQTQSSSPDDDDGRLDIGQAVDRVKQTIQSVSGIGGGSSGPEEPNTSAPPDTSAPIGTETSVGPTDPYSSTSTGSEHNPESCQKESMVISSCCSRSIDEFCEN